MPELPEVEFAARCLRRWMLGKRVLRAEAAPTRLLRGEDPERFAATVSGRTLELIDRRGKYLLLGFDAGVGLLLHLGMTGKLVRRPVGAVEPYSHVRFELEDGDAVHFRDPRKFGRVTVGPLEALRSLPEVEALGPDARDALPSAEALRERLARTRRPLKIALMDQTVLAGLGNIHAAEALFRARVSPKKRSDRLAAAEVLRLAQAIPETLDFALERMPPPGAEDIEYVEEGGENPFLVYGRAGEPCPRCGHRLRSILQGGRTTHYCAKCQR